MNELSAARIPPIVTKSELLARTDAVIIKGQDTIASSAFPGHRRVIDQYTPDTGNDDDVWIDSSKASGFRTAGLALLSSLFNENHSACKDFYKHTDDTKIRRRYRQALAIILAVREDIEQGWLDNIRALITADVFANIIEMADYLLSEHYKDAAAVLVGGSLEGHLKSLAPRHAIDIHHLDPKGIQRPKKAEMLNQELYKADAYKLGDQKQVSAWLNLRNHAAHSEYDKYSQDQVVLMLQGVQNFIVRVPV